MMSTAAVSAYGHFFHPIPEEAAGALRPIQQTSTSQGITLTVQYASVEKGSLTAYLTLEDTSGLNRLSQGVDFYHSYHADKPDETQETFYQYQSLGYDEATHTHGFLVTITPLRCFQEATVPSGTAVYPLRGSAVIGTDHLRAGSLAGLEQPALPAGRRIPSLPCMVLCGQLLQIHSHGR